MKTHFEDNYLPDTSLTLYLQLMSNKYPEFCKTFWFERPNSSKVIKAMNKAISDFEGHRKGGRGDYYREAQKDPSVRIMGISQILQLAIQNQNIKHLSPTYKILDVLGGDGVLARAFKLIQKKDNSQQPILTSDSVADMITQALKYDLPAIRQPAQFLFIRDNSFDAVILAYGTHHIPKNDRLIVCREAFRVLKPGGDVIIHDFEENSPIAQWFNQVVDKYSLTGHKYPHFTQDELYFYLQKSSFKNIKISHVYDPFITTDINKQQAFEKLMYYIFNMYGLEKLIDGKDKKDLPERIYRLVQKYIHYELEGIKEVEPNWKRLISFYEEGGQSIAELPRVALVGTGTK